MTEQEFFGLLIAQIAGNPGFASDWDTSMTNAQRRVSWAVDVCEYAETLLKTAIEDFGLDLDNE